MKKAIILAMVFSVVISAAVFAQNVGQSPETVYDLFLKALKSGDYDKMVAFTSAEQQEKLGEYNESEREEMFETLRECAPITYEVTDRTETESNAYLWLEAMHKNPFSGETEKGYGKVHFVKERDLWKIEKEMWRPEPID